MSALVLAAASVGSGQISDGWEYVWAAWAIAYGAIGLYGLSLYLRTRTVRNEEKQP
ncbi:MAG: hypothetical protein RL653_375 [Pseudomonadota bacterium]|jgi:hypothetical protein